jgi:DNA polymerase III delta subunit
VPNLDLDALRAHIKTGTLAPVYLFCGEDAKLASAMVDGMEGTIAEGDRPFAVDRVFALEGGGLPVDIAASCRSLPMLGDRRLVVVMRAERILKPKRAGKASADDGDEADEDGDNDSAANDMTPLEDYLASPSAFATLVFVASEIDRTRRLTKQLVATAAVVEFGGIAAVATRGSVSSGEIATAQAGATRFIQAELVREGRTIEPVAVKILAARAGGDISKLRGDLERLLLFTQGRTSITVADVEEVATGAAQQDDWGLTNAIGDGDAARALREVALRFDRGDSPHGLVGQLRWWVSNRMAEGAPERVKDALDALLRTDLALKSSGGDDRVLIERLVVELTGRPVVKRPSSYGYGRR